MKKFFQTILRFFIVPLIVFIICVISYFILDPHRLFYKYDTYSHSLANRDLSGIRTLQNKYPQYGYDSFLFGSSRTLGFHPHSWAKYLDKDSEPLSLDAFIELFYGIYHKVKYLDSLNIPINNAIILIDPDLTFVSENPNRESPSYYKYPDIDNSSWFEFRKDYFLSYLDANVIVAFCLYDFFGIKNEYIYRHIGDIKAGIDSDNNGLLLNHLDLQIKEDKEKYYKKVFFQTRGDTLIVKEPLITEKQLNWLIEVKNIFDKDHTNYKIVITPLYSQIVLSRSDIDVLIDVFGADKIYDFSGINEITQSKYNYYEAYHFKPSVGDSIMNYIYNNPGNVKIE